MQAVILAAGDGGRLGAHTAELPKPLLPLHGRTIVDYTLTALAKAGVGEAIVVTGYREAQVRAALAGGPTPLALRFVSNSRFLGGASLSLRCARPFLGAEPFLLVMSDHLLAAGLVERLAAFEPRARATGDSFVAADFGTREPLYTAEATKLAVDAEGRVTAIGKQLRAWDALDTGAFLIHPSAWMDVDAAPDDCELSAVFARLAARRALRAADVSGCFWYDVDTADDLAEARRLTASAVAGG